MSGTLFKEKGQMRKVISRCDDHTAMLSVFRELILSFGLERGDTVIFSGCPGPCYSMATFFAFAIRDLGLTIHFAVDSDYDRIWQLEYVSDLGMVVSKKVIASKAKLIVLMSGLASVPFQKTLDLVRNTLLPGGLTIGETVTPGLFETLGWDQLIPLNGLYEFEIRNPTGCLLLT